MQHIRGELFATDCDALVITTNGFVKANGECVMGKGCAAQAKRLMPELPRQLGNHIATNGNCVGLLQVHPSGVNVLSFPVKPVSSQSNGSNVVRHMRSQFPAGTTVPGWACVADLAIIRQSCKELKALADEHGWQTIALPRPGCGAGELSWEEVKPILEEELDERFVSVTY